MQKVSKYLPLSFLEIATLIIAAYFAFEYKPFEHRLYHAFSKIFLSSPAYHLTKDLNIFFTDIIIALCFFFSLMKTQKKTNLFLQKENKYLWVVFIFSIFSTLFSSTAVFTHSLLKIHQLFFSVILFAFMANEFSKKDPTTLLKNLLFILIIVGVIESIIGLYHYLYQHPLGLHKLGEPKFKSNINYAMIPTDGKVWIFNSFITEKPSIIRAHGTFPHPNILGAFLGISMLGTLAVVMQQKGWKKVLFSFLFFFQSICLTVTFSRSAIFGFFISAIVFLTLTKIKFKKAVVFTTLLIAGSFILNTYVFYPQMEKRGGIVNESSLSKSSNSARMHYNLIALNMMKSHPFLGVGYDQFIPNMNAYLGNLTYNSSLDGATAHNVFLLLGAETGIISLSCFLLFLFIILKNSFQTITIEKSILISLVAGFLFIGLCDYFFLFFQQGKIMFFSLLGILCGYNRYTTKMKLTPPIKKEKYVKCNNFNSV